MLAAEFALVSCQSDAIKRNNNKCKAAGRFARLRTRIGMATTSARCSFAAKSGNQCVCVCARNRLSASSAVAQIVAAFARWLPPGTDLCFCTRLTSRTRARGQKRNDNQFNWPVRRFVRAPARPKLAATVCHRPTRRAVPLKRRQSRPEVVNGPAMMLRSLRSSGGSAVGRAAISSLAGRLSSFQRGR